MSCILARFHGKTNRENEDRVTKKQEVMRRAGKGADVALAVGILVGASAWGAQAEAATTTKPATIMWNGIQWNVKSGTGKNPGFNSWSPANAFVDANGDLHLALTNVNGTWYCAEVWTDATFGFGTFQWQLATAVDTLDPNVVLGLFAYGPPALGPDGTHEIDIEYARFGSATANNAWWTIFPNVKVTPSQPGGSSFPLLLGGEPATTSRFTWASTNIAFATLGGFQLPDAHTNVIQSWTYQPADPSSTISQSPMPVHMNLWLYRGNPPANGQDVDVVIHGFSFTPAATANAVPALPRNRALLLVVWLLGVGLVAIGRFRYGLARHRG